MSDTFDQPDWLSPLKFEDIEEKIRMNLEDHKISLAEFRARLMLERNQLQRTKLQLLVQEQNYNEQIEYIDLKLRKQKAVTHGIPS